MRILAALLLASCFTVAAQSPQVPHKLEFAGMTLIIRDDARREIQKDVDAFTQSPKHYNIKAERARMYFPIIEKVFAEEQLPDEFKYLALQESALIPDAVSTSNAVGFWQFKDFTAIEMGLRVDSEVDERQNIVSSTRAAARYIKKNHSILNNWIYALQAYQMGAGGVSRSVSNLEPGASRMEITSKTYWYVKKFLAHMIAYAPGAKGKAQTNIVAYENTTGKSLRQLAKDVKVEEAELLAYNKWTKSGWVPNDKPYIVVIPVPSDRTTIDLPFDALASYKPDVKSISASALPSVAVVRKRINGVPAVQAIAGETAVQFAARSKVSLGKFLRWNDISSNEQLKAGDFYFVGRKSGRATENFHKVAPGETLWMISQRYGVQLKKLKKFNRLKANQEVTAGTMLWLASVRPKDGAGVSETSAVAVDSESFEWEVAPSQPLTVTSADTISTRILVVAGEDSTVPEVETNPVSTTDSTKTIQTSGEVASDLNTASDTKTVEVTVPEQPKAAPNSKTHTVAVKETLYSIAKLYQIGVMDLVRWNNLDLQHGLKVGQVLVVRDPSIAVKTEVANRETASGEQVHEVKSSDTLYSIARQYGVTIKDLMEWNEKKDFSLAVGEKLKILSAK